MQLHQGVKVSIEFNTVKQETLERYLYIGKVCLHHHQKCPKAFASIDYLGNATMSCTNIICGCTKQGAKTLMQLNRGNNKLSLHEHFLRQHHH